MVDWYDLSGYGNATSFYQVTTTTNTLSGQLFGILFIIISALLVMVILWNQDAPTKFLCAAAIATIEAIFMTIIGMGYSALGACIAILALAILWNAMQKKEG